MTKKGREGMTGKMISWIMGASIVAYVWITGVKSTCKRGKEQRGDLRRDRGTG